MDMTDAVSQTVNPQHGSQSDWCGPGVDGLAASVSLRYASQWVRQQVKGEERIENNIHLPGWKARKHWYAYLCALLRTVMLVIWLSGWVGTTCILTVPIVPK